MVALGNTMSVASPAAPPQCFTSGWYEFVTETTYKGQPLKEHDAVAGVLADIATDIEVIRVVGYQNARMLDRTDLYGPRWGEELVAKSRAYKYYTCDRAMDVTGKAMNLLSNYGADRDWDVEKHWRDLKIVQLWMGAKQHGQEEVARFFSTSRRYRREGSWKRRQR